MSAGTIHQAEYGEGSGVLVFFHLVVGILVTALLYASQITSLAAGLPTHSIQGHSLQKYCDEQSTFTGAPGAAFIYSWQPWGGVVVDDAKSPFVARWDVSILPLRSGEKRLSETEYIRRVAESGRSMKRSDPPPSVQFLR